MQKYHKQIGFEACHVKQAEALLLALQDVRLSFTSHALMELARERQAEAIGKALVNYRLNFSDVFELAIDNGIILKIGFTIDFTAENDIVIILSREKSIITTWVNHSQDNHATLKTSVYSRV